MIVMRKIISKIKRDKVERNRKKRQITIIEDITLIMLNVLNDMCKKSIGSENHLLLIIGF